METIANIISKLAEIKEKADKLGLLAKAQWDGEFSDKFQEFNALIILQGYYKGLTITINGDIVMLNKEHSNEREIAKELEVMYNYLEFENAIIS